MVKMYDEFRGAIVQRSVDINTITEYCTLIMIPSKTLIMIPTKMLPQYDLTFDDVLGQ